MASAPIFDIQRFCIHDGPGIRTVVFLKGCPLRCQWCSNPESQSIEKEILFDARRCVLCHACLAADFGGAMREVDGRPSPDRSKPVPRGLDSLCPSLAIRVAGRDFEDGELVTELLKDEAFFRKSDGGVTFSGGEPLIHRDFLLNCVAALRNKGIAVAIETCLAVKDPPLERLLAWPIHWLLDLKHVLPGIFREKTGGDLGTVLGNLTRIAAGAASVTFRIPLIPGFNESDEDRKGIFDFLAGLDRAGDGPPKVHILPYHDLAAGKYSHLGRSYPYAGTARLDPRIPEMWKKDALRRGFHASIGG